MGEERKNDTFSILSLNGTRSEAEEIAAFYQDLNLRQIIDRLTAKWGKNVRKLYSFLPPAAEDEAYRRAVFGDVKKDEVFRALMSYTEDLEGIEELRAEKNRVTIPVQKAVWQIRETEAYCRCYEELESRLEKCALSSSGMQAFLEILKDILESGGYRELRERTGKLMKEIRELRFTLVYDKDRISVVPVETEGSGRYEEMLRKEGGREVRQLQNPFRSNPSLTELEYACLEILEKKRPQLFRELRNIAERSEEYEKAVLRRFEKEVIFYLSFRSLELELEKAGLRFSTPETSEDRRMEAKGLYDLALALTALASGKEVVPNDLYYEEGERFFVLTGPNQGGKTTFARSLGQLVYFTRMGLDVPAESANVPFFPDIQTHFSVEESVETGRGKLKEELSRLAPMMEEHKKGSFVIINELFTTAASYDAEIMGKKVLKHFIGLGCMGIYVTHLKELAEEQKGVVSLRAMLNDQRIQTFKIRRGDAEDIPCAENVVNKYRLNYEQLKERL